MRGRVMAGIDAGGSNRITAAGGNFDGTVVGNFGGQQNRTLTLNELPAHSHSITDPGHNHTFSVSGAITTAGGGANLTGGGGAYGTNTLSGTTATSTTGITTTNSTGAGNLFSTLPPTMMGNYQIKY
jgi:microcystin-dependent protein